MVVPQGIEPCPSVFQTDVPARGHLGTIGRNGGNRTHDPLVPNQVRCQTAPHSVGGEDGSRTRYLLLARQTLFQMSYIPMVETLGFEPREATLPELLATAAVPIGWYRVQESNPPRDVNKTSCRNQRPTRLEVHEEGFEPPTHCV